MFGGATGVRTSRESPGRVRNIRNFRKHHTRVCMYEELMPGYRDSEGNRGVSVGISHNCRGQACKKSSKVAACLPCC